MSSTVSSATEKIFKRAVARSQSPHAFGSALDKPDPAPIISRGRRLSFDELNEIRCHVAYHGHKDEGFPWECIVDAVKAFGLGFGVWVVPVSAFYRRLTGFRRGIALGLFFSTFRSVSCTLFRLLALRKTGRLGTDFLRRFVIAVSGFVSGAIFSSVDTDARQAVFVLWIAIRALRALLPAVPFGDVVIMMFSASNILSTYVHHPTDNTPSYARFLMKFGGKTAEQLAPFRETGAPDYLGGPAPICPAVHPNQGCLAHLMTFTFDGLVRAIPLYIPVHLAGFLLSSHKKLDVLASNVIRSSLFLSTYCSSAWYVACKFYLHTPGLTHATRTWTLIPELVPGLAVLLERPSRRRELASYCMSHALNSYWNWAQRKWGLVPRDWVSVLILAFSFGTLLQHFEEQPNAITSYFFGICEYPVVIHKNPRSI